MRTRAFILPGALLLTTLLGAQQNSGTLRGVLTDTSGAVIPTATVSLTAGSTRRITTTQTDGSYAFAGLAPADYAIKVEFPGFVTFEKTVTVDAGKGVQFSIQLTPGGGKQEVTVSGEKGPELSTDPSNNQSALIVAGTDLDALPDDPDDLSDMLTQLAGPASGPTGGAQILLDGFSNMQLPPKASIKEIRINSNPFSTEYDSLGFGRIEIITKPGADSLRGGIGLTDSDAFFNSRNPYAPNKADYVNRMFTTNLGGPLSHRASFLVNFYQSTINNTALIDAVTLAPATLAETPIHSSVLTPRNDISGNARLDYQISTNNTFTGSYQYYLSNRDNNGIGQYSLVSREYNLEQARHDVRLTETAVLNSSAATETKFAFTQISTQQYGDNSVPGLIVSGAFNAGSAQVGRASNMWRQYEFQNNTTVLHGSHTVKFGARVRYTGITDISPANFGGTFSFFGESNAPVLNANNQVEIGVERPASHGCDHFSRTVSPDALVRRTWIFTRGSSGFGRRSFAVLDRGRKSAGPGRPGGCQSLPSGRLADQAEFFVERGNAIRNANQYFGSCGSRAADCRCVVAGGVARNGGRSAEDRDPGGNRHVL